MKKALVGFGIAAALLLACVKTAPTVQPATTSAPSVPTPTRTPLPTITPTPIPTVPAWSPYQPDDATGWCWQEVVGQVKYLNDVAFWDTQTGWAVGERGAILHTGDGGAIWQWQNGPVTATLQHVDFVSSQSGWILGIHPDGGNVVLLKTDDGGTTWVEQPSPSYGTGYVHSPNMAWPDADTGWLTIGNQVFRTSDGGQTWQEFKLPGQPYQWSSLSGVDGQHAWVAADYNDTIIHTDDGGVTWTTLPITATQLAHRFVMYDMAFVDAKNGWAVSRDTVVHTSDGGRTWRVQLNQGYIDHISFKDTQTGWGWNGNGGLWSTTDGGLTWEQRTIPLGRYAVAFVGEHGVWAVGRWAEIERSTIAYSRDEGETWEMQDTHIETPVSAYVAASRLAAYAAERDAPWEGLLPLLLPGPCMVQANTWLLDALHDLGWIEDSRWVAPLLPTDAGYVNASDVFQHLDMDVDADGENEVVILGSGDLEMIAGILDWDGARWQVAWTLHSFTRYSSGIRARVDDFNADGHPELLVETLNHPASGTGFLVQRWDVYLVHCAHLNCQTIWARDAAGYISRAWNGLSYLYYGWLRSDYRFIKPDGITPAIVVQTHGIDFRQTPITTDTVTSTLTVLTSTQSVYVWDGAVYTPTSSTILTPAYTLDMNPITTTLSDGAYAVQSWEANPDGVWQTLSIYGGDTISPTQVFTAAFTGVPGAGVWLQDTDGDGEVEVKDCDTGFSLAVALQFTEQTSVLPECTMYRWDSSTRKFRP